MMPLAVTLLALAAALWESRRPARAFPRSRGWWTRALLLNLVQFASAWCGAITWDRWFEAASPWTLGNLPPALQVLLGYLAITFIYYFWHRARHEVPFLWRWFHQVHHSPGRIEIPTSFYKHPFEVVANGLLSSAILVLLLGLESGPATATVLVTGIAELFYHWNIRTPHALGYWIQRPESHCVHHEAGRHAMNYADLPIWDWLFGTLENPRGPTPPVGFDPGREVRIVDMLKGRDVHLPGGRSPDGARPFGPRSRSPRGVADS